MPTGGGASEGSEDGARQRRRMGGGRAGGGVGECWLSRVRGCLTDGGVLPDVLTKFNFPSSTRGKVALTRAT